MKNKKTLLGVGILVVAVAALLAVYWFTRPQTEEGVKQITVQVYTDGQMLRKHEIRTTEEYLRGALEQEGLIAGEEQSAGFYVQTVDGVTADESQEEWWCLTKGGESLTTGVDATPIADGDTFELTLTVGW
ncbi:MAG TPA: DUF4430 domain-containing protein [Firmicutes bacterium]|nr:DUF4430 domain-containing protein [Bacillota bacterium]